MFRKTAPQEKARIAFVSDEQPLPIIRDFKIPGRLTSRTADRN